MCVFVSKRATPAAAATARGREKTDVGAHLGSNLGAGEARYRRRRGRPWEDAGILTVRQGDLTVTGSCRGPARCFDGSPTVDINHQRLLWAIDGSPNMTAGTECGRKGTFVQISDRICLSFCWDFPLTCRQENYIFNIIKI